METYQDIGAALVQDDRPKSEHGIYVDSQGNVWLAGNDNTDHQILTFTGDGKFLQQIGKANVTGDSNSQDKLGRPAHMVLDEQANELYVADGYKNCRVIVFDSKSGAYKRHWGAYGHKPNDEKMAAYKPDAPPSEQFSNPVHCVRLSNDGFVYVCDRTNDRIQVFRKDGAFVKEFRIEPDTLQNGSVWVSSSRKTQHKNIFSSLMVLTVKSSRLTGTMERRSPNGAVMAANQASSNGFTTLPST